MSKSTIRKGKSRSDTSLARRVVELREQVEGMERDKARLGGMAEQVLQRLKEEHGCSSLQDGKKKLSRLDKEITRLEKEFEQAMEEYEAKWRDKLE